MQVEIQKEPRFSRIEHLFILLAEGDDPNRVALPEEVAKKVKEGIRSSGFTGKSDESLSILHDAPRRITVLGLGQQSALTVRSVKAAVSGIAKATRRNRHASIAVAFPYLLPSLDAAATARTVADLLGNSDYRYDPYITVKQNEKRYEIRCAYIPAGEVDNRTAKRLTAEAAMISAGVELARDLGNAPPNEQTPTVLGERARAAASEAGIKCTVYDRRAIEKMKMGALLAVNRGAAEEPRLIVMEYSPRKAKKTVCLVGKGITFDSGGISIKPAEKMEEMKFDMCGAAAVIGAMVTAARLELPLRLVGIVPATENLPSGSAYKPGDIITTMSGKTVEIVNTDAEGRMILSDALHFSSRFEPDHVIDYATLTGACVVALGGEASGLFSNDDELAQKLIQAGQQVGERFWRLPEWDEYKEYIRSEWADMKNSGGRWGGAITAAVFLKEFVGCPSWAHLDIAGTAWAESENGRDPKGATGVGVRATIAFLESLA